MLKLHGTTVLWVSPHQFLVFLRLRNSGLMYIVFFAKGILLFLSWLVFLCWHIWKARNKAIFYDLVLDPVLTSGKAQNAIDEVWLFALPQPHSLLLPREPASFSNVWRPPAVDSYKINVDASFNHSSEECSIGVILRNSLGSWLDSSSTIGVCSSPLVTEALALQYAVAFAVNRRAFLVVFETDSK